MKNKKSLLSLGLLALVLVLGVGYAVVSSVSLTIGGEVSANSDIKVSFKEVKSKSNQTTVTATTTDGSLTATFNVTDLSTVGQTEYAIYTIQNKETDVTAKVSLEEAIQPANSSYFEVETDLTDGTTIAPGDTLDVKVSVTLIATPLTTNDSTADVTVKLEAEAVTN